MAFKDHKDNAIIGNILRVKPRCATCSIRAIITIKANRKWILRNTSNINLRKKNIDVISKRDNADAAYEWVRERDTQDFIYLQKFQKFEMS